MSYLLTKNPTMAIFHKREILKRYRYTQVHLLFIYVRTGMYTDTPLN